MRTTAQIQSDIDAYTAAETRILTTGQEVDIGGTRVGLVNMSWVQRRLRELRAELAMAQNNGKAKAYTARLGVSR